MRKISIGTYLALLCGWLSVHAATTPMQIISFSAQIGEAVTEDDIGAEWRLGVSMVADQNNAVNRELALAPDDVPYTHLSFFVLENDIFLVEPMVMEFAIDLPQFLSPTGTFVDANNNAVPDFFDVDVTIDQLEFGEFFVPGESRSRSFSMHFFRDAGAYSGLIIITFPSLDLQFSTWVGMLHHAGTYTYTRTGQVLDGSISLALSDAEHDTLAGPFDLTIAANNRLTYPDGTFNTPQETSVSYSSRSPFGQVRSKFFSVMEFVDGRWDTPWNDYQTAMVFLPATDANANGTPDLVEGGGPTVKPTLAVRRTAGGLELVITGEAGVSYTVLSSETVNAAVPGWTTVQTVNMTSATTTITLPFSAVAGTKFFRVRG